MAEIVQYIGYAANTAPPTPPPGVIYTFLGSDGATMKQINSAGTISNFGGGGGGTVSTDATMTGDGSGGNPLHCIPTFGVDTLVSINNASSSPVTALEAIASLTATTAGAEASQWLIKLLTAGAQTTAMTIGPGGTLFPNGTAGTPGVAVRAGAGMYSAGANTLNFSAAAGQTVLSIDYGGGSILLANGFWDMRWFDATTGIKRTGGAGGDLLLYANRDVVIGASGALATSAVAGLLQIPTCAGTPTGNYTPTAGKVAIIYDTTADKMWRTTGAASWKSSAFI